MPSYCELPFYGEWFEPLNSVSNVAFLVAAYYVWNLAKGASGEEAGQKKRLFLLAGLLAAIGVGSFLWHFFRTPWSLALDVIPINLFLVSLATMLVLDTFRHWLSRMAALGLFVAATAFGPIILQPLQLAVFMEHGGAGYLGSLVYALCLVPFVWRVSRRKATLFAGALLLFVFSLTLRQLDLLACASTLGYGLHLFWHILNAVVLFLFSRVLVVK